MMVGLKRMLDYRHADYRGSTEHPGGVYILTNYTQYINPRCRYIVLLYNLYSIYTEQVLYCITLERMSCMRYQCLTQICP